MMGSWWVIWMLCIIVFLAPPLGYGWGYRGWGPPYPRYVQRRRALQAASATESSSGFSHHSWGWGGDLMWLMLLVAMIWGIAGYWSH